MSEKQGLPEDSSASPQTIPPAALRDIPGALSFSTLLPKSPGQLVHPLRKVFQTYSFLKLSRHKVPELNGCLWTAGGDRAERAGLRRRRQGAAGGIFGRINAGKRENFKHYIYKSVIFKH